jgi:AhpD family alkylhydroperoxidase
VRTAASVTSPAYHPAVSARVDVYRVWPEGYQAMQQLEQAVRGSGLEHSLLELVKTRASQINQCAFCIDMHTKDARAAGETEQRLYALSAWRETPFFTERERAALAMTEALTLVATSHHELGAAVDAAKEHFDAAEMAKLTYCIVTINAWNRLAITAAGKVGGYVAGSL